MPGPVPPRPGSTRRATELLIDIALGLLAVCLLVAATAVFVAAEFALVAVDRTRIARLAEEGSRRARTAQPLLRRLSFHLSGAQLGITVASLILGFIAEPTIAELPRPLLEPFLGPGAERGVSVALALTIATFLEMVLGELVPKTIAIARSESTTLALSPFLRVYGLVFGPLIRLLDGAANWTVRRLGIEPTEELSSVRSLSELALMFRASAAEGTIGDAASRLLSRSIRFAEKDAAEVLVPRTEVATCGRDDSVADLVALAERTGFSRFPVVGTDIDDIVGVVLVKQVHRVPPDERPSTSVAEVMTDALVVPESRDVRQLLLEMRDTRNHFAVVVDEYGGTAGIVTLEDLVEEIVGDIADEYDPLTPPVVREEHPGEFVLSGLLHPDEVEEATGLALPEGDYETIAGFVLDRLGHLPEVGEAFHHDHWRFEVVAMDRRRIDRVRVGAPPGRADPADEAGAEEMS
ncbi:MAG: hemolysin family protein [Acidimicrobiales bacterium]